MSFRRRGSVLALIVLGLTPSAALALREQLAVATEKARQAAPAIGVHVVEVESGETVYAYEPDRARILASNTKLFTSAAALDRLSPGYFIETALQARGLVLEGRLHGDLAVVGAGDPAISGRHYGDDPLFVFRQWGRELRASGIESIAGDLLLVDSFFEPQRIHPDWPRDQLNKWYEAPVSALAFNDNCVWVWVLPGAAPGDPARVEITPDVPTLKIENRARTASRSRDHSIAVDRRDGSDVIEVSGWVYRGAEPFVVAVTVPDPPRLFGDGLRAGLAQAGVTIEGVTRMEPRLPESPWRVLARHRTSLQTVLEVVNKRSQNLYAETLLKLLGAEACGEGGWSAGARAVESFLSELGIEPGTYSYVDGSGMSRNDRFTPRQLTTLLRHMYFHPHAKAYMQSLAYGGESDLDPPWMTSSLSERFDEDGYRGNVLAKTGGLNGVSTLSGYVKARSGKVYAFSILCNSTPARWRAKEAQDRIVRALVDNG